MRSELARRDVSRADRLEVEERVESLCLAHPSLDVWLARLLSLRGVKTEQVENFLEPRIRHLMPDPSRLADMDKAVERLVQALGAKQKIGIITDYDVDGACCAAMFISYWRALGGVCSYTIPDRIKEGYGSNLATFTRLFDDGVEGLVLTTDCGTNEGDVFACARKEWAKRRAKQCAGKQSNKSSLDVIVLDHHEIAQHERAPAQQQARADSVFAMVNPQRADNEVDASSLSACGVVFMLLTALRRRLVADGIVSSPPELRVWLDLVALSTICDVVELTPLNRAFVRFGLQLLNSCRHAGLAEMARVGKRVNDSDSNRIFSPRDLGFFFGPRLNACGRMGYSYLAVELLLCVDSDSAARARQLARKIEELNAERRELQSSCCEQVLALVPPLVPALVPPLVSPPASPTESKVYFFSSLAWSVGVLGPSASRLAERLCCPVFLANEKLAFNDSQELLEQPSSPPQNSSSPKDLLRGSARLPQQGWDSFNLARVVGRAKEAGLLLSAGGHSRACGFTLQRETAAQFRDFLNETMDKYVAGTGAEIARDTGASAGFRGFIDMELLPSAATISVAENLSHLAPFGRGNEEPLFAFRDVFIDDCRFVGRDQRHLVCFISVEGGVSRARAIAYDARSSGLGDLLLKAADERQPRWLVGKVRADNYRATGQIIIEDFACFIEGME